MAFEKVKVGAVLNDGYCGGLFGGYSYNKKRIEALGVDWVVAREIDDEAVPCFATEPHDALYKILEKSINHQPQKEYDE